MPHFFFNRDDLSSYEEWSQLFEQRVVEKLSSLSIHLLSESLQIGISGEVCCSFDLRT